MNLPLKSNSCEVFVVPPLPGCEAAHATTHSHSAFWRAKGSSHTLQGSHKGFSALMFSSWAPPASGISGNRGLGSTCQSITWKMQARPSLGSNSWAELQQMLWYLQAVPLPSPCSGDSSFPLLNLLAHRCAGNTWGWVLSEAQSHSDPAWPPPIPAQPAQVLSACFVALPKPGTISAAQQGWSLSDSARLAGSGFP